ncbi:DNA replication/repair protein RecF [Clostridium sp. AF18-27]|uniref:DNA replication and repair protein RecF n=1 Tax=Enterocloster lavalensis TaxID=460384 RepID=A0A1I0ESG0_9FIRM|nr:MULTISPECIES: DNA replication/repair protein RecF [Enterocloster]MBS5606330.1 DNA replication/repair protein RecF [Enterocloster asparagiformis]RHR44995.1 DNA replication/repair protein RecF [Clostridium sp. AF18-27]MCB6347081.1 DNA replication/repair protein RecF [Enterocloster lavalensis]MDR3758019.1 DNA replication/repair protein RecF [Enterocloster sp.]PST29711.1 DNA replication/repair protein RecF [Enterocloster lavalensis]
MIIESIELKNYRNYEELHMELNEGTNILYGDNAQGKTNILEAVYVCCTSKSHKNAKDRDIIRFDQDESHIKMQIRKNDVPYRIDMHLKKNKPKGIAINGMPIRRASELFGIANVVCFSPEDLNIIKNGPSERRRFIDMELCQLNKLYVHSLVQYNKVLVQRNKLLKELAFRPDYGETLDVWDMQLVNYGKEVMEYRGDFVCRLNEMIHGIHARLSGQKEDLKICYEPDTAAAQFEEALKRSRTQDMKQKTTLCGPHRDDISFFVNGIDIRKFGSQGQQRTAALSLKLSELELVKQLIHDRPILLLDDVLSELDAGRQNHLLNAINDIQTIITCTGLDDFVNNRFKIDKIFKVIDGAVVSEN